MGTGHFCEQCCGHYRGDYWTTLCVRMLPSCLSDNAVRIFRSHRGQAEGCMPRKVSANRVGRSAKSALHGMIHWLANAYAKKGITVNGIAPALIEQTKMLPGSSEKLSKSA